MATERRLEKTRRTVHTLAWGEPPRAWDGTGRGHSRAGGGVGGSGFRMASLKKYDLPPEGQPCTPKQGRRVFKCVCGGCSLKQPESAKEEGTPGWHPQGRHPSCPGRMSPERWHCSLLHRGSYSESLKGRCRDKCHHFLHAYDCLCGCLKEGDAFGFVSL